MARNRSEVKTLVTVLAAGVIAAILLAVGMVWHYNPKIQTKASEKVTP